MAKARPALITCHQVATHTTAMPQQTLAPRASAHAPTDCLTDIPTHPSIHPHHPIAALPRPPTRPRRS
eukprot:11212881-Prorocentrum_lima.AAC.1